MSTPPLNGLATLFHRRWAVPVLVELDRAGGGAKFVTLARRVGASRDPLRATLDHLIGMGLVARNPGYGHPMRPEYLLTARGHRVAAVCGGLMNTVRRLRIEPLALKKWTMPVTWALGSLPRRFSELRDALPDVTPRALTLSLKDMQAHDLVLRQVTDDYPPATAYRLERRARPIRRALDSVVLELG